MPLCLSLRSEVAKVTYQSAIEPFEMKCLVPLSTKESPSRRYVVLIAATSEPAPGSVIANAQSVSFLDQASEVGRFLLFVAGDHQRQRRQFVGADRVGHPGASVIQLLDDDARVEDVESGAALLARHAEVHQAGLEGRLAHVAREDFLLVVFARARNHLALGKFARQAAQVALLFGKLEADHFSIRSAGINTLRWSLCAPP